MTLDLWNEIADSKKANILQAALKVFADKGYDAATTRMIAAEAGIANGLLFYHYKDKQTLFSSLAIHLRTVVTKQLSDEISCHVDVFGKLLASISQKLSLCSNYPEVFRFFLIQMRHFPDDFKEQGREVRSLLALRAEAETSLAHQIMMSALDGMVSGLIEQFYAGRLTADELLERGMESAREYIEFFRALEQLQRS